MLSTYYVTVRKRNEWKFNAYVLNNQDIISEVICCLS